MNRPSPAHTSERSDTYVASGTTWRSWLGIAAVVLGVLVTAAHGTSITRQAVLLASTPGDGVLPPAACPADELEEENLSAAECRQMVSNVRSLVVSAPEWFPETVLWLGSLGLLAGLASVVAGAGLLQQRSWATGAGVAAFGTLAAIDAGGFIAALNAGPILRDIHLWDAMLWFTLHLMMAIAVVAGARGAAEAVARPPSATDQAPVRPLSAGDVRPSAAGDVRPSAAGGVRPFTRTVSWGHALLAISVFFLFASSWWMLALPLPSAEFTYRAFPFQLHKNLGITLVFVVGLMLYARFRRPPSPPASRRLPRWMHRMAVADHVVLYGLILVVGGSGYMSSSYSGWATTLWWLVDLPHWGYENEELNIFWSDVHLWSCWALLGVVAVHLSGALYHSFRNDGFVRRMLRP